MSLLKKSKKTLISSFILASFLTPTMVSAEAIESETNMELNVAKENQVQEKIEVWEHLQDVEESTGSRSRRSAKKVHDLSRISYNFTFDILRGVCGKSELKPDGSSMTFDFDVEKGAPENYMNKNIQVVLYKNNRQVDSRRVNFEENTPKRHYVTFKHLDSKAEYSFELKKAHDGEKFSGTCSVY